MKILNLYAGIGGNRKLWGDNHQITAVENDPKIAQIYQDHFPNDHVLVEDAHEYLLNNYKHYDFIWSSPPCPSHSRMRFMTTKMTNPKYSRPVVYPDMRLYQEIILLRHYFEGVFVVENVKSYYDPLIKPQQLGRHYFWTNLELKPFQGYDNKGFIKASVSQLNGFNGFDLGIYKGIRKDQIIRNTVKPELGKHVLDHINL